MTTDKRVESVATRLEVRGVKPIKIDKGTAHTDPVLWITESVYLQICDSYILVVRSRPTGLASYNATFNIDDIMKKLKQAIDEGK